MDDDTIDVVRLRERTQHYARVGGASDEMRDAMDSLLASSLGRRVAQLTHAELGDQLISDAYKPRMHKVYSTYYTGVDADFVLNVRRTPFTLARLQKEDPELLEKYERARHDLAFIPVLSTRTQEVLRMYFNFETTQAMQERVPRFRVAPLLSVKLAGGEVVEMASGPIEAASNTETSMTQLVQEFTICAQAGELRRSSGIVLDRTERVANALGKLAGTVTRLQSIPDPPKMSLFAGRRSSDRAFLLLQNLFCAAHLPRYAGTSSVYAAVKLDTLLRESGIDDASERLKRVGPLLGTLAHELVSVTSQLLSWYDEVGNTGGPLLPVRQPGVQREKDPGSCRGDITHATHGGEQPAASGKAGSDRPPPVALSALLAHLLFLRANSLGPTPTALSDTFGTCAFVAAALACRVPAQFAQDMRDAWPHEAPIPPGAFVFDLFRVWRLDSGVYEDMAEVVIAAWEQRRAGGTTSRDLPRPLLMHSNLRDADEVEQVCRLPQRVRPNLLAFGGLADGFLPFEAGQGRPPPELHLASVVMKAVQARVNGALPPGCMPCAGKLGDDANKAKAQVDPRLEANAQQLAKDHMTAIFNSTSIDSNVASAVLARMYHDVTRKGILCSQPGGLRD